MRLRLDLSNAINSNVILTQNTTWGTNLDRVEEIIQGRLIRLGGQFHF